MQVHLTTLGCRLNEAELESWATGFMLKGHAITQNSEQADIVVINTCAVTQDAVRKSRQLIRRTHRNNPTAKLVISGCYSSLNKALADEIEGIDLIVPNHDKGNLVELTVDELNMPTMPSAATAPGETSLFKRCRQRAFIKIQDGCRYRCTYCIVTIARGSERSRSIKDIIDEINHLTSQGIHEAVLTGVHVGGYGSAINCDLYELIKAILSETDLPRLRLASVEPWDLPDRFFELFSNPRLMPHMHLPLQSGSDSVLKRMSRRCKTADFKRLIDTARKEVPDFNVTTDVIVGFPGETEKDIEEKIKHLKASNPDYFTITIAYPIKGTEFYQEVEATQTKQFDWTNNTDRERDFRRTYGRKYYDFAVRRVVNEVNYHKEKQASGKLSAKVIGFKSRSLLAKAGMVLTR